MAVTRGQSMGEVSNEGVRGLKALGVRDLTYRLCFLACGVEPDKQFGIEDLSEMDENKVQTAFTQQEQEELRQMRSTENLYQVVTDSIAPHVFGASFGFR